MKARIDYFGIVLLSTAVSLLLIWVTNAGKDYDWWSTETILMVGGALARRRAVRDRRAALQGAADPPHDVPQPHLHARGHRVDLDRHRDVRHLGLPQPVHAARPRRHADRGRSDDDPDDRRPAAGVDRDRRPRHPHRHLEAVPHRRRRAAHRRVVPAVDDRVRHELRARLAVHVPARRGRRHDDAEPRAHRAEHREAERDRRRQLGCHVLPQPRRHDRRLGDGCRTGDLGDRPVHASARTTSARPS